MLDVRKLALLASGLFVLAASGEASPQFQAFQGGPHISIDPARMPAGPWIGDRTMAVITIDLADSAYQYTPLQVEAMIFGLDGSPGVVENTVVDFWKEASYGQFRVTGDVIGPVPITASKDPCDQPSWAAEALEVAINTLQFDPDDYDLIAFSASSDDENCKSVGLPYFDPPGAYLDNLSVRAAAHELGHGLGLGHASSIDCDGGLSSQCTWAEYGDLFDVMGAPNSYTYNQLKRGQLGWFNASNTVTVTGQGPFTYNLYSLNSTETTALKSLRVPRVTGPNGPELYYYVELRQKSFFDTFQDDDPVTNGTLLRLGRAYGKGGRSYLVDATPGSHGGYFDAAFVPQGSAPAEFVDPITNTVIRTLSVHKTGNPNSTFAQVEITPGTPTVCTHGDPTASFYLGQTQIGSVSLYPGESELLEIQLSNGDSAECFWVPITGEYSGVPETWDEETLPDFERALWGQQSKPIPAKVEIPSNETDFGDHVITLTVKNLFTGDATTTLLTVTVLDPGA